MLKFSKNENVLEGNEESFDILKNILIFEMESSKLINYSAYMC
jgi:hypothetical protein